MQFLKESVMVDGVNGVLSVGPKCGEKTNIKMAKKGILGNKLRIRVLME